MSKIKVKVKRPKTLSQPTGLATEGLNRFLRSQPRRIGLGIHIGRDPSVDQMNISWAVFATAENRNFLLCSKAELSTLP